MALGPLGRCQVLLATMRDTGNDDNPAKPSPWKRFDYAKGANGEESLDQRVMVGPWNASGFVSSTHFRGYSELTFMGHGLFGPSKVTNETIRRLEGPIHYDRQMVWRVVTFCSAHAAGAGFLLFCSWHSGRSFSNSGSTTPRVAGL